MNNKGTTFNDRLELTLMVLKYIWLENNVAMIDIMLSTKEEWVHTIVASNLLTTNIARVKEISKSFQKAINKIFEIELTR